MFRETKAPITIFVNLSNGNEKGRKKKLKWRHGHYCHSQITMIKQQKTSGIMTW